MHAGRGAGGDRVRADARTTAPRRRGGASSTPARRAGTRWTRAMARPRARRFGCTATCAWGSRATACTPGTRWPKASSASARSPGRRRSAARAPPQEAEDHLDRTSHFWRTWLADGTYPDHPWRSHLQRSALALKGLTFMPTGALVAAPTTSLPETPRRRTQLGLPLLLDARRLVHAVGAARARAGLGGGRLHPVPRRHASATRTGRCRSCTGSRARRTCWSRRSSTSRATRARARCGSATAPTISARTTCTGRCSTRCTCTPRSATTFPSGCGRC